MALTILQQPQSLTFVGNIPELIVQTDGLGMTVNISKGANLILAEYYTADDQGRSRVLLRDFLDEYLHLDLPGEVDLYEQTRSFDTFTVEIISGESTEEITFTAIKGGSSTLNLDCASFLKESWLTWQPQIKKVKDVQVEWLSFFTQQAALVKIKGYFPGGTSETKTLHSLATGKHYTVNMTYSDLRNEFVDQPIYIDVWVENDGGESFSSYVQRYVLTNEFFEWDDFFLFKNSVGGLDTIRLTGQRESTNPIEVDAALFEDEYERDYQVNPRLAFEKNTGFFRSREELLWSMDFFQAKEKYFLLEEAFTEIRLLNPDYSAPENTLTSLDFKFSYTRQTIYLSLFKKKSPLIDPIIIGPGDDDFYLPPNIGEFPQQSDPSGLLFPVQKPGTPGWFFITWENLLADILENIPSENHNQLNGLQGGQEGEYFHLTAEELQKVQDLEPPAPQEGIVERGTLIFESATLVHISGYMWNYSGVLQVGGEDLEKTIPGVPTNYNRIDALVGDNAGNYHWIQGQEEESITLEPVIPSDRRLLEYILRTPAGDNTLEPVEPDLTIYVDKVSTGTQQIASNLAIAKQANASAIPVRYATFSRNGLIYGGREVLAGVYSTQQFVGGYSPIVKINTSSNQIRYYTCLEWAGISANFEKGHLWIQFRTDASGDLVANELKAFGEIDITKLIMIRTGAEEYTVFVHHNEGGSFFKFRPIFEFAPAGVFEYIHEPDEVDPLPAGDQYSFELYGEVDLSLFYTKEESDPLASSGAVIEFDRPRTYGEPASPITTATLTEDNDPFRKVTQVIFHQAASFNPPATWQLSTGSDDYDPAKINVIYVEAFSTAYKRYIIDHDE